MSNELNKIESFTVNHKLLVPGIYISRQDKIGLENIVTTFDIRVKRPNFEDCMQPAEAHTIEHLGATYFRNKEGFKNSVIYFGPMGCLTGFYLILDGYYKVGTKEFQNVVQTIMDMFKFVVDYQDRIPGTTPIECGNYRLHNLENAKNIAANMLVLYEDFDCLRYEYPTEENSKGIADSCSVNSEVLHKSILPEIDDEYYDKYCDDFSYEDIAEIDKSLDASEKEMRQVTVIKKTNKKSKSTKKKKLLELDRNNIQSVSQESSLLKSISRQDAVNKIKTMTVSAEALF